ncbi:MAG: hypothetical protein KGM99_07635 [Burkholderiales bacterium]|nr:hypothetical protein [Burkholderiales bacterium]
MHPTLSLYAALMAIPELKAIPPAQYAHLFAEAESKSFSTPMRHWRAVLVGGLVCLFYFLLPSLRVPGSFFLGLFATAGFAVIMFFICDYLYMKILRNAVLAQIADAGKSGAAV